MTLRSMIPTLGKLGVFLVVTLLCTLLVGNTLYRPLGGGTTTYQAQFSDTVGLKRGSDVRIAGVRVGRVTSIELDENDIPTATFEVLDEQQLPGTTEAHMRYADLLGARYIALKPGAGKGAPLQEDDMIPLDRTKPAVDLTALFNGFAPVFNSLAPADLNQLARELVAVFQGEGGTINSLLSHVVKLTENIANQDELIGEVLTGLRQVTDFAVQNEPNFTALLKSMAQLVSGMAKSRGELGKAIDSSASLARSLSGLVVDIEPALTRDLRAMDRIAGVLVKHNQDFINTMAQTPKLFKTVNRASEYGAWLNVYVCNMLIETGTPLDVDLNAGPHSGVCQA